MQATIADGAIADGAIADGAIADGAIADGAIADGVIDVDVEHLREVMYEGKRHYDQLGTNKLLADEVTGIQPSLGVAMCSESFIKPTGPHTMVSFTLDSCHSLVHVSYSGVLVRTPNLFSIIPSYDHLMLLVDAHSHAGNETLEANIPNFKATQYLEHFCKKHYPRLHFSVAATHNPAEHVITSLC